MVLNRRDFNQKIIIGKSESSLRMVLNRRPLNPTFSNQMIHEWLENDVKSQVSQPRKIGIIDLSSFENDVKSYVSQPIRITCIISYTFENDVKS